MGLGPVSVPSRSHGGLAVQHRSPAPVMQTPPVLLQRALAPVGSFVLLTIAFAAGPAAAADLELHFINVGQAHAALVRSPDGTTVLIDGGGAGAGTNVIVPYLNSIGVSTIDYGIASHWHSDHIGGMDEVFNAGFGPTFLAYDRGDFNRPSNGHVTGYLASVAGQRQTPNPGFLVSLGGGVTMEFVVLNGQFPTGSVDPWSGVQGENASSIGIVIRYGDFDAWIGGDLTGGGNGTANVEGPVSAYVGQVEVALSNHHGSNTSSSATWVSNLSPAFVVHSCGANNSFGHPTQAVTNRWNTTDAARVQWSTTMGANNNGSGGYLVANSHIVVSTDGDRFEVRRVSGGEVTTFSTYEQLPTLAGPGDLAIAEVLVDPLASSDTFGEWFEFVNVAPSERSLAGLHIESGALQYTLASPLVIGPGERCLFGVDGREARNGQVFPAHCAPFGGFTFANFNANLTLRAQGGAIIETVIWGSGGFQVQAGVSAERIDIAGPPLASNFADAQSAWAGGDLGTPGEVNDNGGMGGCGLVTPHCTGSPNSVGPGASIGYEGDLDVATNDFTLTAVGVPPVQFGIFYYGPAATQVPFGDGFRCITGQTVRLPILQTTVVGAVSYAMDFTMPPGPSGEITAGSTWHFQFWYRDPTGPGGNGFNLTDALEVTFCAP